jgi:hypothetical protein
MKQSKESPARKFLKYTVIAAALVTFAGLLNAGPNPLGNRQLLAAQDQPMYVSMRRYKLNPSKFNEFIKIVKEGFLPIISKGPGFIAYYGIDEGDGVWATVSIFETKAGAEESSRMAADFIKKNLESFDLGPPEITGGDVVVYQAK